MRILVTGGAGFIGSHVVDALVAEGHEVSVLDDLSNGDIKFLPKGITLFQRSITEDLNSVFEKAKPEAVFHFAAQIDVRKALEAPKADANTNILGALNVLEACRTHKCKRFIFASTAGVYGDAKRVPTPETEQTKPLNPYAISKLAIEQYLSVYHEVHGISYCVLRYANVYGPRQGTKGEGGVVAVFVKNMIAGTQCTINGDGKQTRDFVFVKDVVAANLAALHKRIEGVYNVSTQTQTTVNDLYAKLALLLHVPWKAQHALPIKGEIYLSELQIDHIRQYWQPKFALDDGLMQTVQWFSEHR